jgi:hypothetical protein
MIFVKIEKALTFNRLHHLNLWINIVSLLIIFKLESNLFFNLIFKKTFFFANYGLNQYFLNAFALVDNLKITEIFFL